MAAAPGPSSRKAKDGLLRFSGHKHLRQRLVLAILSGKSIRVDGIRPDDVHVGLRDYEVNLLRLVEKVTNGSTIDINLTGTSFLFHPGLLPGGTYTHTCPRSVGYYLELLVPLAPFCKKPFSITLDGITGDTADLSADMVRTVTLPHLHLFGIRDAELQIKKRGAAPGGGGSVLFSCPNVRQLATLRFLDAGRVRRIRGIAYSTRVSPQFANRMVEAARGVLNRFIPDIYLYTDVYKGEEAGKSPGYGITLVAQSTTDAVHSAEALAHTPGSEGGVQTPEDVATHAARLLLEEISHGGAVDSKHQWLVLLLMVLGKEDVGKCLMGDLTAHTIQFLRDVLLFFGVKFKISPAPAPELEEGEERPATRGTGEVLVSCVGVGYSNVNKAMA
ncbi:18S rRNA biogenesis protein [Cutaneotrichosporon oleaginosum]|uniref:18S rRNA biogenesis protein n=1 Tax=Cutaneotrichosporon oleaginosum TaxID=879819 RepID=A0A0J0XJA8_9TREE|nr:18S rRNA biogenesis protein [Cutaneotrichosporon oleaginosum]KLT41158.1 18S rRNA biogenesis protein [Cutaneotrichosporon oleaginosum]TXT14124.1 hypothetical protein COLE_00317 [Cutaneotrichosporon oleaginosum]